MKVAKLTKNQKLFVDEYLIDLNATRAYKAVYKSCRKDETARANSSRLLTNANVREYLSERQNELQKRTEVTQDMVVNELAKIAFANATEFVQVIEKTGKSLLTGEEIIYQAVEITPTNDLSDNQKSVISSIKETKHGIAVESYDKVKALELLGRHLGMFKDNLNIDLANVVQIIDDIPSDSS